jgi:hypothetical protein
MRVEAISPGFLGVRNHVYREVQQEQGDNGAEGA